MSSRACQRHNTSTQLFPVDELAFWEKNPRRISDKQMKKLKKSIESDPHFLHMRPILVNHQNDMYLIYAGNQRARAAISLQYTEVPCIIEENLSDDVMRKRSIMDNKTFGEWDYEMLANEWDAEFLIDAGFTEDELGFEEKPNKPQKYQIILEFESEEKMDSIMEQINSFKKVCNVKVKK